MKAMKCWIAMLGLAGWLAGTGLAAEAEKKPCCAATVEAQKKCAHKCCVKAAERGMICQKCHPQKGGKK